MAKPLVPADKLTVADDVTERVGEAVKRVEADNPDVVLLVGVAGDGGQFVLVRPVANTHSDHVHAGVLQGYGLAHCAVLD